MVSIGTIAMGFCSRAERLGSTQYKRRSGNLNPSRTGQRRERVGEGKSL